ncbi:hypothetical protein ACWGID_08595 [Kribbella sp. NPDC054772]
MTVEIRPTGGTLATRQEQVLAAFSEFINAQFRHWSHPWVIDPVYARSVLPDSPYTPLATDNIGQTGPVVVQLLSVDADTAQDAKVTYCLDARSVRYLGRDGAVDVPGPPATGCVAR